MKKSALAIGWVLSLSLVVMVLTGAHCRGGKTWVVNTEACEGLNSCDPCSYIPCPCCPPEPGICRTVGDDLVCQPTIAARAGDTSDQTLEKARDMCVRIEACQEKAAGTSESR